MLMPISTIAAETTQEIIVWNRLSDNPVSYQILQLALNKTKKEYAPFVLKASAPMEQGRVMAELSRNQRVHVASFAPNQERESKLLPVRIPVTRGLLGLRVCLIQKDNQHLFSNLNSLQQWVERGLSIGQGKHWPDTDILEANKIKVVKSAKYTPLFAMLAKKRFDCFSRSVSEVLPELEKYADSGIVLEQELVLVYRLPSFFFVSKNNPQLSKRLEKGMRLANQDGSFDQLIRQAYQEQFKKINLQNRKVIYMNNPYLSEETRKALSDKSLWLNPLDSHIIR